MSCERVTEAMAEVSLVEGNKPSASGVETTKEKQEGEDGAETVGRCPANDPEDSSKEEAENLTKDPNEDESQSLGHGASDGKEEEKDGCVRNAEEFNWPSDPEVLKGKNIVLIGIDEGEEAEYAFNWYMNYLHQSDNLVVFVYALVLKMKPDIFFKGAWDRERQEALKLRDSVHEKYREKIRASGLTAIIFSDASDPGPLIVAEAKKRGATYIVVGTRELNAIQRVFLTSVSSYVSRNAHCTVLVCKKYQEYDD